MQASEEKTFNHIHSHRIEPAAPVPFISILGQPKLASTRATWFGSSFEFRVTLGGLHVRFYAFRSTTTEMVQSAMLNLALMAPGWWCLIRAEIRSEFPNWRVGQFVATAEAAGVVHNESTNHGR